jgi:(p)ppGpp synthase/HD superfamily hydrolase
MDTCCPWCGDEVMGLVHPTNYDANLEAHAQECETFLAEQGL